MADDLRKLSKLTIVLLPVQDGGPPPTIPGFVNGQLEVEFNPTEYSIDRESTFAEVPIPGLDSPILQYVRGGGDKMSFELFLDTTDSMQDGALPPSESVRDKLVRPLERLLLQHET